MPEHKMVTIDGVRYRPEHVERAEDRKARTSAVGTDKAAGKTSTGRASGGKAGGSGGNG
ncbi:hypothetical protein [Rhodococcus pyridinivorans]|uniref:Uncharacterized protein n=1 Tax=Rhodococcus pyridinivorans TaxID=103816 RepID=A0A7M2XP27_9NOCA|nr:hypothetical protein [Rhodococcus pyridinivorans]QOV99515.1 hypothetical protein INP59_03690 [Rhodococcus pyridinivorans]